MTRPKYIIVDNKIIMGEVQNHYELALNISNEKPIGGGRFQFNNFQEKILYFYGSSMDFGKVTKEQFEDALKNTTLDIKYEGAKIIFSIKEYMSDVLKEQSN